jgi:cysteine synthase
MIVQVKDISKWDQYYPALHEEIKDTIWEIVPEKLSWINNGKGKIGHYSGWARAINVQNSNIKKDSYHYFYSIKIKILFK